MSIDERYDEMRPHAEFRSRGRRGQPRGKHAAAEEVVAEGEGPRGLAALSHRCPGGSRRTGLCRRRCLPGRSGQLLHGEPGRGAPRGVLGTRRTSPWPPAVNQAYRLVDDPAAVRRPSASASFSSLSGSATQGSTAPFQWLTSGGGNPPPRHGCCAGRSAGRWHGSGGCCGPGWPGHRSLDGHRHGLSGRRERPRPDLHSRQPPGQRRIAAG